MRRIAYVVVFLIATCNLNLMAQTQASIVAGKAAVEGIDLAITYTRERARIVDTSCECFWFRGGTADAVFTFYRALGVAAQLTGQHASDLSGGGSVGKIA
jgi:hypothetical protein